MPIPTPKSAKPSIGVFVKGWHVDGLLGPLGSTCVKEESPLSWKQRGRVAYSQTIHLPSKFGVSPEVDSPFCRVYFVVTFSEQYTLY